MISNTPPSPPVSSFRPLTIPLYRQIEEHLQKQIGAGIFPPGSRLPSDAELGKMYKVSRITVRHAIDRLVNAQLAYRKQGAGTFVTSFDQAISSRQLVGYIEEMHPSINFRLLESGYSQLPCQVTALSDLSANRPWRFYVAVNHVGGAPMSYLQAYYPPEVEAYLSADDFLGDLAPVKLIELRSGRAISHATQVIEPVAAPEDIAQALGLSPGTPIMRMMRVYFAADEGVLDVSVAHYHPEKYRLTIKLIPASRGTGSRQKKTQKTILNLAPEPGEEERNDEE